MPGNVFDRKFSSVKLVVAALVLLNVLLLGVHWFTAFWRWKISDEFVPLHYTIYFGFDRFGPRSDIFLFATLGTIIFLVNMILSFALFGDNRLWRGVMQAMTALFEFALLGAFVLVILKGGA